MVKAFVRLCVAAVVFSVSHRLRIYFWFLALCGETEPLPTNGLLRIVCLLQKKCSKIYKCQTRFIKAH